MYSPWNLIKRILKQITHIGWYTLCWNLIKVGQSTRMHCIYQNCD